MRYTEKKYDFIFDSPHDFVRVIFSATFLAPFRFFNEMSKKVLFLGKKSVKELINTGITIAGLLFVGEAGYQFFFSKLSLFGGHIPLLSVAIAIVALVFLNKFVNTIQLEDMDIFEETDEVIVQEPQPMSTMEVSETDVTETVEPTTEGEPTPITEEIMSINSNPTEVVVETPVLNPEVAERLKKYDAIMEDDHVDTDLTLDDLFKGDTMDILDSTLNPIDDNELSETLSNNTKELLGDNYKIEKDRFEDLINQFDSKTDIELPPKLEAETISNEDDFLLGDDFELDDFDLDSYLL